MSQKEYEEKVENAVNEILDEIDDDTAFKLTPKALFMMALQKAGFIDGIFEDDNADYAWFLFTRDMKKSGYIDGEID